MDNLKLYNSNQAIYMLALVDYDTNEWRYVSCKTTLMQEEVERGTLFILTPRSEEAFLRHWKEIPLISADKKTLLLHLMLTTGTDFSEAFFWNGLFKDE